MKTAGCGALLILASAADQEARALAQAWRPLGARLVTPRDIASPGMTFLLGHVDHSVVVAEGDALAARDVQGVLTRLAHISPEELYHLVPADRTYAACETGAFLLAWLSELQCPMINRPTAACLAGPGWSPRRWRAAAESLGFNIRSAAEALPLPPQSWTSAACEVVSVVGGCVLGARDPRLAGAVRALARMAHVAALSVCFDTSKAGSSFVGATPWLDLRTQAVRDAARDFLLR